MGVAKLVKGSKREKLQLMFDLIDDNGWCGGGLDAYNAPVRLPV